MAVVLAYLVCAIVWGTTWFAIRVCIGEGGYPTIAAGAARFTIAAFVLALIVGALRAAPGPKSSRQRIWLMVAGLLFIQPIIALTVDYHWEADANFSLNSYVGAAVTMSGVLVSLLWKHKRRAQSTSALI